MTDKAAKHLTQLFERRERLRRQLVNTELKIAHTMLPSALGELLDKPKKEIDRRIGLARGFLHNMLARIPADLRTSIEFTVTETEILSKRLAQRFDPGMALNEATERAMAAKKASADYVDPGAAPPPRLYNDVVTVDDIKNIKLDGSPNSWAELAKLNKRPHENTELTGTQQAALGIQAKQLKRRIEDA